MAQSATLRKTIHQGGSAVHNSATPLEAPSARNWQWLRLAANAALPVALLTTVAVVLSIWHMFLTREGYIDYGEGLVLFHQTQASQGLNVYDPAFRNGPPYSIPTYGPVFYYLVGAVMPRQPSLLPGRLISVLSLIGVSGGSWWFLRKRCGAGFWLSGVGAVVWLVLLGPYTFGANNRIDSLAVFFGLAALVSAAAFPKAGWRAAIPLLLLAGFTKPTSAVAPAAAIFLTLVADKRWKEAICLTLTVLLGAFGILAAGDWLSQGNFSQCLIFSNANAVSLRTLGLVTNACCMQRLMPVGILLGGLLVRDPTARIFGLHAIISFTFAVLISANIGAHVNYFIEPSWAAGFCLALFLHKCPKEPVRSLGIAVATGLILHAALRFAPNVIIYHARLDNWPILSQRLRTYCARGPILTGESGALVLIGQQPFVADPHIVKRVSEAGKLDVSLMIRYLREQEFSAVIAEDDICLDQRALHWTDEVRTLVATHYQARESIGNLTIYVPRPTPLKEPPLAVRY